MKWYIEDAAGEEHKIDPESEALKLYSVSKKFSPSEATLIVSRRTPTLPGGWIRAEDGGKTKFLGYIVGTPTISPNGAKTILAYGVEALLWYSPCPLQSYWAKDVLLSQVFGHADPDTSAQAYGIPGLIFAANSMIPPGFLNDTQPAETTDDWIAHGPAQIVDAANGIVKYPNLGTRSRVGSAAIFVDGYPYVEKASYALMAAGDVAVYRDENDLYLRHWLSDAPIHGWKNAAVMAKNAFDTRCRFGGIDTDSALDVQLLVDPLAETGDILFNLARSVGQYIKFEYIGKLCYVYVVDDYDEGTMEISREECHSVGYIESPTSEPDAVTGLGHGANKWRQQQSIFQVAPGNAFVRKVSDFPYTFCAKNQTLNSFVSYASPYFGTFTPTVHSGKLFERTLAEWNESRYIDSLKISVPKIRSAPINSIVTFRDGESRRDVSVMEMDIENDNVTLILGKAENTINDARQAVKALSSAYTTTRDDFNEVAVLSDTQYMTSLVWYIPGWPSYYDINALTTWSYWLTRASWGFQGSNSPPLLSYGIDYYRDHNIRLLMDLHCEPDPGISTAPWSRDKCYMYISQYYNDESTIVFVNHNVPRILFNPLEEDIQGLDITEYLAFGNTGNTCSLKFNLVSPDTIRTYRTLVDGKYNYQSQLKYTLTLTVVEYGYSAKRKQYKIGRTRCGALTVY